MSDESIMGSLKTVIGSSPVPVGCRVYVCVAAAGDDLEKEGWTLVERHPDICMWQKIERAPDRDSASP